VRRLAAALLAAGVLFVSCSSTTSTRASGGVVSRWDWPTYGHDPQHTFHGLTTLSERSVKTLEKAWFFPTGDAVTATPTVVRGTVYVGSWDDYFYALNFYTGALEWKTRLTSQNAIEPYPGETPRPVDSDGGLVTSSAWYEAGAGKRPDLVIFGGGYTLYALNAHNGSIYWSHDYTGRPDQPPEPDVDGTRIFSSPVVVGDKVIFGVDVDGQRNERGYVVAASLATGDPVWEYQTDLDAQGRYLNDGCGSVWSSGTVLPEQGLVVFDVADCHFSNPPPSAETVFALHIDDGRPAWVFRPARPDDVCDFDFGATVNAGLDASGKAVFLGVGSKDGTYYSIDPKSGKQRWSTNVVFGGFSGGFMATSAYDGTRVYGATGIGDYGRFEHGSATYCDPSNPRDVATQEPSVDTFDAATGKVDWQGTKSGSFSPTTVAGGMTFDGLAVGTHINIRDARTGSIVEEFAVPESCWSGIATVGDAIVFGTGSSYQGTGDGIEVATPEGVRPVVPG
jgi:outer membrane protein assembly factor BamB